ncbi:GNAT family N-acetyltransferase [Demequina lignilytica]|uniref:GNAT family N-acetyltransferase n=1 Tax=Demequina lignilytica TaxID=3051663 RepID=A0AB35MHY0_9MICO|nr:MULTISPECIES: GNAT family N-acetyltransferase [unclassified Demequina]MDN4483280.1 GNAT family N-acetyltransferase [Demequina sp. SYSU T0a273]MDN4491687.1 GNAT family N-acetyltransferase [Demequina sp. SYSU T00068]
MITIRRVAPDDPDAFALWEEQRADLARRYDDPDLVLETSFPTLIASLVGYGDDGEPIASAVLRWSPYATGEGSVEVKRVWVRPAHRGHGHSKVLMGAVEAIARRAGATSIVLETGTEQPEAMALYERLGYRAIPGFGEYKDAPDSRCYGIELPTRVLVLTGAMGAGKTAVSGAAHTAMSLRGARVAFIDADLLCEAYPSPDDDWRHQRLMNEALAALAPVYRRHGYGCLIVPRILEDAGDRAAIAHALAGPGGPAEVTVIRVTAPLDERVSRLHARETSERWLEWAIPRTAEQAEELDALAIEDASVENSGRHPAEVAEEALDLAGW